MDIIISIALIILTAVLLLPVIKKRKEIKRISKHIDILPGAKWYPVIGTTWHHLVANREAYFDILRERHALYGPVVRSWFGSLPAVHIYKPEHAQIIFKSNTIIHKGSYYRFLYPWLGQGLISGSGPKWREHRKIITPSFHFKVLDRYGEIFAEKSEDFVKYLEQFEGKGYFEVSQHLTRISVDIISETAMGVKLDTLKRKDGKEYEYISAIIDFCTIVHKRIYNPILANDFTFSLTRLGKKSQEYVDLIHNYNSHVIQTRKADFKSGKRIPLEDDELGRKHKMSFLDMLLAHQENNHFGDDEIEEEVNTFMFGGQDTTATTLTYAFLALGNYPDVQKRIHEELDSIFANDPSKRISAQDVAELNYMDRFVKEVLRCFCFVPMIARKLEEDIEIDGHFIPRGVTITISLYDLHHDPDHYPDPFKFDPDRFLPENVARRHPFAFVPFSAGPRNCLGQKFAMRNVKTLLANIMRKYRVKCQEKPEDIKYYLEIVLRPQNGIHVALESRK